MADRSICIENGGIYGVSNRGSHSVKKAASMWRKQMGNPARRHGLSAKVQRMRTSGDVAQKTGGKEFSGKMPVGYLKIQKKLASILKIC